jgi:hypothetical protein
MLLAMLLAALEDEATTAEAAWRHLATLSELTKEPVTAVAIGGRGP